MSSRSPFSGPWLVASIVIFTALELFVAIVFAPAVLAGRLASPMWRMRVEMMMHLGSFWLGGLVVGVISPRVRMLEPAVGAFASVALVLLTSVFMPHAFLRLSSEKLLIGGGIAFLVALAGAHLGERLMGNVDADDGTARGRLRKALGGERGAKPRGEGKQLEAGAPPLSPEEARREIERIRGRR